MEVFRRRLRALSSFALVARSVLTCRPVRPRNLESRLAALPRKDLPVEQGATIRWNRHQIPWIEAETDRDAAVALGLVHAHLRLGHMEILRRVAAGRTAEMIGPAAVEVDRALRTISLTQAVPGILAMMPSHTRMWLDGFVDGINHYVSHASELPPEFDLFGLKQEPWTAADVMAVGRAAVADVNWLAWIRLLRLRLDPAWPSLWDRLLSHGTGTIANLAGCSPEALLGMVIGSARTGSNAYAVSAEASATGGALLASDPHLPITVPNIWMLAAWRCPSYHVAGIMLPGLPFVAIGRNPHIAWGGTAPHTASSDLFDLSSLPDEPYETRTETIRVRGGKDEQVKVRLTRFGPILSDAVPMGGTYALRWVGHDPSDELSCMLGVNRARSYDEFQAAADLMAVPGQNFVMAETSGGIAKQIAAKLPHRPQAPLADLISRPDDLKDWDRFVTARDFAPDRNPRRGYVVSANDRPAETPTPLSFFYSPVDRVERIGQVLAAERPVTLETMMRLQRDVEVPGARVLRDRVVHLVGSLPDTPSLKAARDVVLPVLRDWDGSYQESSRGALAFELMVAHICARYHNEAERAFYAAIWTARTLIARDLEEPPRQELLTAVGGALDATARELKRYAVWGDLHRLELSYLLGRLPLVGRRFVFSDLPVGGTSDAVMKTAHPAVAQRHRAFYGSIARFATDLSQEDESYALLLGGQDGWLGSSTMLDQVPLWREGRMIRMPLNPATAAREFEFVTHLMPGQR